MSKDPAFLFKPEEWFTPNTYDNNFKFPTENSGIYLIVYPTFDDDSKEFDYEILYIGSAKNLRQRYEKHEVMRVLREVYNYIQFYFKEESEYRKIEKQLIKQIQPRFNKQWR